MINTDATVAAIRDSLRLVKRHPIVLTPQIIFVCLLAVWEYLFPPWEPSGIPIPFIEVYSWPPNVIPLLAQLIVYSMYPLMIKSELSGNGLGIKGSAVKTLRKIPPLVTGSVLIIGITLGPFYVVLGVYTWIYIEEFFPVSVVTSSLLVWVGIVVSVVWAVISFRWYAYAIQAITINDVGPVGGLRRSKKFVKERKPPFFILLLLIFAIIILISLIASVPILLVSSLLYLSSEKSMEVAYAIVIGRGFAMFLIASAFSYVYMPHSNLSSPVELTVEEEKGTHSEIGIHSLPTLLMITVA